MKENRRKVLMTLDIVEIFLTLVLIMIFTLSFKLITTNIRFLFLAFTFIMIYSLSKSLNQFEKRFEKRIVKYSNNRVESKYLGKIHA